MGKFLKTTGNVLRPVAAFVMNQLEERVVEPIRSRAKLMQSRADILPVLKSLRPGLAVRVCLYDVAAGQESPIAIVAALDDSVEGGSVIETPPERCRGTIITNGLDPKKDRAFLDWIDQTGPWQLVNLG